MHEYTCGKCGWTARTPYLEFIRDAWERHAEEGCQTPLDTQSK